MNRLICTWSRIFLIIILPITSFSCSKASPIHSSHPSQLTQTISDTLFSGTSTDESSPLSMNLARQGHKDLNNIEPGQVCVVNTNLDEAKEVEREVLSMGFTRKKRRVLEGLEFVMSIYQVPLAQTVRKSIDRLRSRFPTLSIDANDRYEVLGQKIIDTRTYGQKLVRWDDQHATCGQGVHLGLVDTKVDRTHPVLKNQKITTQSFLPEDIPPAPEQHGTAVAALLVGNSLKEGYSLLPKANLLIAEVFRHRQSKHVDTTTWTIIRALDWLVKEGVQVINLSLGGPPNFLLTFAIQRTLDQGVSLIAAAGNGGPAGSPMYPAALNGVIGVTAIDAELRPYKHATRGQYISFSAPGVDIWIPNAQGDGTFMSGTSYAAPFVAAAAATLRAAHPQWSPIHVQEELERTSMDLGKPGRDQVFGWGLIQASQSCP